MSSACIYDCAYLAAPDVCSVQEVIDRELELIRDGVRTDMSYDHVHETPFKAEPYLAAGYEHVPVADHLKPIDLAVNAIQHLLKKNAIDPADIDAFIYYDAIPWREDVTFNMPSCIAERADILNLKYCSHVTQRNCTSGLAAIEAAAYLLTARADIDHVLVAGGDAVDSKNGEPRVSRNLIFGDAGSAALVCRSGHKIEYIQSRFIPMGGRRYLEPLEQLAELSINGFRFSFNELGKAFLATGFTLADMDFIVTNSPPFNRAMDRLEMYPYSKRTILDDHVRGNALTTAHIAMGCLSELLRIGPSGRALLHATGLGTNFTTAIISFNQ